MKIRVDSVQVQNNGSVQICFSEGDPLPERSSKGLWYHSINEYKSEVQRAMAGDLTMRETIILMAAHEMVPSDKSIETVKISEPVVKEMSIATASAEGGI